MADSTTRGEAREAIRQALLQWAAEGVPDAVMPVYADVDGDGRPDFFGLTPLGQLETLSADQVRKTADEVWVRT